LHLLVNDSYTQHNFGFDLWREKDLVGDLIVCSNERIEMDQWR
jgi:hypothetical protein